MSVSRGMTGAVGRCEGAGIGVGVAAMGWAPALKGGMAESA